MTGVCPSRSACMVALVAVPEHNQRFLVRHGALYLDLLGRVASGPPNAPDPIKNPDGDWMSLEEAHLAIRRHEESLTRACEGCKASMTLYPPEDRFCAHCAESRRLAEELF